MRRMRQAVIVNGRLDAPPARRTASADAESRYPVAGHRLRSNAFRREVPSHKLVLHAPWRVARRARSNSHNSLGVGYRPKIPASIRLRDIIDPKHARKSLSRRHGQVSPDVTHVAVKELIAKGGHATIVSTHRGSGQDNRDILMLVGNRSESIVERPAAAWDSPIRSRTHRQCHA